MLNPLILNRCDIYIILWVVYYLQGILYETGGVISQGLLAIILLISLYYAIKVSINASKPIFFEGLKYLLVLFTLYGVALIIMHPGTVFYHGFSIASYMYLKQIYLSLLPIYPFYYFTRCGYLTEGRLRKWVYVFFLSAILSYFQNQFNVILHTGADEITNNAGYLFALLIPSMILFIKEPVKLYVGLAIIIVFVVLGMKRGAILIAVLSLMFFIANTLKNTKGIGKIKYILLTAGILFTGFYFVLRQMATNEYMISRIEQTRAGDASARGYIYAGFWSNFTNADLFHCLFGFGANGTLETLGSYAHNDWLEILTNQGGLGVFVFIVFFFCFYKTWNKLEAGEPKTALKMIWLIIFVRSFFSMSYGDLTFMITSVLGYYLAVSRQQLIEKICYDKLLKMFLNDQSEFAKIIKEFANEKLKQEI